MKNLKNIFWGLVLVAVGVFWGLKVTGVVDFNVFFDGWWTLLFIVPSFIGLFTEREKLKNLIVMLIGVILLLCCRDVLDFETVWKLVFPAVLVVWGLSFIFKDLFSKKSRIEIPNQNDGNQAESCSTFSSQTVNFGGEEFHGAKLTAVFGSVSCDLRNAIINEDAVINCSATFGGIDIFVPYGVKVKIKSSSMFGGVSDKIAGTLENGERTIYINATCLFGGVEIK